MIVNTVSDPRKVDDYDITFENGLTMPITIDKENGDTIEFDDGVVRFYLAEKTTIGSDDKLPAEDITLFIKHIVSISHRTRTVVPVTPEQRDLFKSSLHKLSATIQ